MRILFVNSGLRFGGAETQLIAIIRELKRRGHEPALYLLTRDAPRADELSGLGVPVVIDDKRSRLDFAVVGRLRAFMRRWRPDLVQGFLFDANVFTRLAAVGSGIPLLNAERNHGYKLRREQWLIHRLTRGLVDGVVANSQAGREFAQAMFALPPHRTHVVWNGIDLEAVDARLSDSATDYRHEFFGDTAVKMATLVGTINPQKDHHLALEVAEALIDADPRWRVLFVGAAYAGLSYENATVNASNQLQRSVEARWRSTRNADRIRFVGQRKDALEIIAASNVLFSTSRHEGFPNVVMEAMAVGTPVVATAYSDIHLILQDSSWVIDSRNPVEMARAMQQVSEHRSEVGPALRHWIEKNATIEQSVNTLLKVYAQYVKC
jgi:glycosyltransferase involved in cell wall biosynthesis